MFTLLHKQCLNVWIKMGIKSENLTWNVTIYWQRKDVDISSRSSGVCIVYKWFATLIKCQVMGYTLVVVYLIFHLYKRVI